MKRRIIIEDDDEGFGVIAWFAAYLFLFFLAVLVVCVFEHGG